MFPLKLGQICVTANRLAVGDPDVPPPGTILSGIRNGTFDVVARTKRVEGEEWVCAFGIDFAAGGAGDVVAETFSIDSKVVCVADPDAPAIPRTWWLRRPVRREFGRRLMRGVSDPHYLETFLDPGSGLPWALAFLIFADGVYTVRLRVKEGEVTRLDCDLF